MYSGNTRSLNEYIGNDNGKEGTNGGPTGLHQVTSAFGGIDLGTDLGLDLGIQCTKNWERKFNSDA